MISFCDASVFLVSNDQAKARQTAPPLTQNFQPKLNARFGVALSNLLGD